MAEMDVQKKKGAPSLRQALGAKGVTPTPDGAPQTSPSMPAGPGSSSSNGQRLPPQVNGGPAASGPSGGIRYLGPPIHVPGPRPFGPPQDFSGVGQGQYMQNYNGPNNGLYAQWKQRQMQQNPLPMPMPAPGRQPIGGQVGMPTRFPGQVPLLDTNPQQLPYGGQAY